MKVNVVTQVKQQNKKVICLTLSELASKEFIGFIETTLGDDDEPKYMLAYKQTPKRVFMFIRCCEIWRQHTQKAKLLEDTIKYDLDNGELHVFDTEQELYKWMSERE